MTIEEINSLTLDDVRTDVTSRVISKYGDALDEKPALFDDLIDKEFEVYINELITAENIRLDEVTEAERVAEEAAAVIARQVEKERIEGLTDRLEAIGRTAFHKIHNKQNMAKWIRDDIEKNPDHADAESKVAQLEAEDASIQATPEMIKGNWKAGLYQALADNDISTDGLLEALVRKEFFADTTLIDAMKDKMIQINTDNPRPIEE